jgi:hypothetical protein
MAGSIVLLPVVVLAELALNTRYPVPLIFAFFFVLAAVLHRSGDLPHVMQLLGFDGQLNTVAVTARSIAALAITASLYPLYRWRLRSA